MKLDPNIRILRMEKTSSKFVTKDGVFYYRELCGWYNVRLVDMRNEKFFATGGLVGVPVNFYLAFLDNTLLSPYPKEWTSRGMSPTLYYEGNAAGHFHWSKRYLNLSHYTIKSVPYSVIKRFIYENPQGS